MIVTGGTGVVTPKSREVGLRRIAARRGLALSKSATRDPAALTFNRWKVVDATTGRVVVANLDGLDGVAEWLDRDAQRRIAKRG